MSLSTESAGGHVDGLAQQARPAADAAAGPGPVCLVTRFSAVDDAAARRLLEALRATAASVVTEPGHLSYGVFVDQSDARSLYVLETWASASDARRHEELVVSNGAVARVTPLLAEELQTRTLRPAVTDGSADRAAHDGSHVRIDEGEGESA